MKGVYIHVPFCKNICNYCDFCKMYYKSDWVLKYLDALKQEISERYENDLITSIYIGGGTPNSLSDNELEKLMELTTIFKHKDIEFCVECNIDITSNQLAILRKYGVNRLSIGLQSVSENNLKFLGRFHTKEYVLKQMDLITKYFDNINVDLIYAIPNQNINDLIRDLEFLTNLKITHISTYSLMIEPHTKLYIDGNIPIDDEKDFEMYKLINEYLVNLGFNHYEISNYCKKGYESKHNLIYWNNDNYYGFGLGASGYLDNIRYDNTKNFNKYLQGKYIYESHELCKSEDLENFLILGFRKIEGISKSELLKRYGKTKIKILDELIRKGQLNENEQTIYIPYDRLYTSNNVLVQIMGEIDEV